MRKVKKSVAMRDFLLVAKWVMKLVQCSVDSSVGMWESLKVVSKDSKMVENLVSQTDNWMVPQREVHMVV